jgi:hypothetical protein
MFESRRRSIQRFLKLPILKIEKFWFPLLKYILRTQFKNKQELKVAINRMQGRDKNVFMISLILDKRALPLYWQILPKRGCSNLREEQSLRSPILGLLKNYKIVLLRDREFGSVQLASWLCEENIRFVLRVKQGRYIQEKGEEFKRLSECGLVLGRRFYLKGVKVTKQKGFSCFDVAAYWRRKYRNSGEDEGWYLLTNIGPLKQAVTAFKCRSGIEAMFKDCKTGGYNLEKNYACDDRLKTLILLRALAYSCAILQGRKFKQRGIQKYISRLIESRLSQRRHSSFWIGLYGQSWVLGMELCHTTIAELMKIRRNKRTFFHKGLRAMSLILSSF